MRKTNILTPLFLFALALTACGGTNNQSGGDPASAGQGQGSNSRPISPETQLVVGIFKLEGTPQAVDAQEAAKLVPLWQLFDQLSTSSSSAQQEVSATFDQIKSTMSPAQIDAINAMNLTNRDAFTFLQQQGIIQTGGFGFSGTPDPNRTPRAGGGGGGFPGGGGGFPGGGGGGFPGGGGTGSGQNLNPDQIATIQARRAQGGGFSNGLPPGVLDALIKLLQSKITPALTPTPTATSTETPAALSTETPAVTPTP